MDRHAKRKSAVLIKERDEMICQICLQEIDSELPSNHPLSFSIDHVIPKSAGGTHEIENLQSAHRICNIHKSNKTKGL